MSLQHHTPHPHIAHRRAQGPHLTREEHLGFNGWLAVKVTDAVGTMVCGYVFCLIAFVGLPTALTNGPGAFVQWLSSNFIQLVLLPVIIVGQKISARVSDKRAVQLWHDVEAILHEVRAIQQHLIHLEEGTHGRQ